MTVGWVDGEAVGGAASHHFSNNKLLCEGSVEKKVENMNEFGNIFPSTSPPLPPSMNSEKSNSEFLEINVQWGSALVVHGQIFEHSSNYFTISKITKMLIS